MTITIESLPDDPVALKALLLDQQKKINGLQAQVDTLFESLRLERYRKYGKKSEKDPGQQELFDEAEQIDVDRETPASASTTKRSRKSQSRKPLPEELPRVKQLIELEPHERQCSCGCELTEIGESISEQLDIIPAQVQVRIPEHRDRSFRLNVTSDSGAS